MTINGLFGAIQAKEEKMLKRQNTPLEQVLKETRVKHDKNVEDGVVVAKLKEEKATTTNSINRETSHHSTGGPYSRGVNY